MLNDGPWSRFLYPALASLAGAITALSFLPFESMSRAKIGLALFVGASFAIFVGPYVVHAIFGDKPADIRLLGGVFYIMASGSNVLIPMAIRKMSGLFGTDKEASR